MVMMMMLMMMVYLPSCRLKVFWRRGDLKLELKYIKVNMYWLLYILALVLFTSVLLRIDSLQ